MTGAIGVWRDAVLVRDVVIVRAWPVLCGFGVRWVAGRVGEDVITWRELRRVSGCGCRGGDWSACVVVDAAVADVRAACVDAVDAWLVVRDALTGMGVV